jgi:hypothetical protein
MIILKETRRAAESFFIRGKGSKEAAVLSILANRKVSIRDSNILQVERF